MLLKYLSLVMFLPNIAYSADILAILPTPSYSHQIAYRDLWKELSLRGHQVTVITTDPLNDPKLTNLTEIDMNWTYKFIKNISKQAENDMTMWNVMDWLHEITMNVANAQLSSPEVQSLIHNGKKFDLVFVEFIYTEFLALAEIYKCPKIIFSTMDTVITYHQVMGNPAHPVLHEDIVSKFVAPSNFRDRLMNSLFNWHLQYQMYKILADKNNILRKYFSMKLTIEDILSDVDMLFLNVNPATQSNRATGPTTINVGDLRRATTPTVLPKDLATFLDDAKTGFIYFSLGSNVKSKDLNKDTLRAIIETLGEVPYKVLWKFEADYLPGKPDNVKLVKWTPQQTILAHPNIKLFITQGGLQSMEETIYAEVPCVVIPFFGDQDRNAQIMSNKGIAKVVSRHPSVKKDALKDAILEVITDPRYKNSVKKLRELALDTPMTGMEKAIWWTEYVLRHKGAKHLRNPAADLPFYQYYLIDILSFLILTVSAIIFITIFVIKKLIKLLYSTKLFINYKKLQ